MTRYNITGLNLLTGDEATFPLDIPTRGKIMVMQADFADARAADEFFWMIAAQRKTDPGFKNVVVIVVPSHVQLLRFTPVRN